MKLSDLKEAKKVRQVSKTLREHYEHRIDFESLSAREAKKYLTSVKKLIKEAKASGGAHSSHKNAAYLKLLLVEQGLTARIDQLAKTTKIIVENESVQKSQVILAAQDIVDSVQKMLEQISKINIEEMPAVVDGIKNEFGVNESHQYRDVVKQSLESLQSALSTARDELSTALNTVTGEETGVDMEMPSTASDLDMDQEPSFDDTSDETDSSLPQVEPEIPSSDRERR